MTFTRWLWRWLVDSRRSQYWRVSWPTHEPRPKIRLERGRSRLAQLRDLRQHATGSAASARQDREGQLIRDFIAHIRKQAGK